MDGAKIRAYRRDTGLTQAQLGAMLGVTGNTVNNWEAGRTEPSRGVRLKLAVMIGKARNATPKPGSVEREFLPVPAKVARHEIDRERGSALRFLRSSHDMTRRELSGAIGYSPAIVMRWEDGEYTMSDNAIEEIERFFRVSLRRFVGVRS